MNISTIWGKRFLHINSVNCKACGNFSNVFITMNSSYSNYLYFITIIKILFMVNVFINNILYLFV